MKRLGWSKRRCTGPWPFVSGKRLGGWNIQIRSRFHAPICWKEYVHMRSRQSSFEKQCHALWVPKWVPVCEQAAAVLLKLESANGGQSLLQMIIKIPNEVEEEVAEPIGSLD